MTGSKQYLKGLLGGLPYIAETDYALRHRGRPIGGFHMERLRAALPVWRAEVETSPYREPAGKNVFIFGTLHYWIEHTTLLSLALAGLGNQVMYAFLPYANWYKANDKYQLRQQHAYSLRVLKQAEPVIQVLPLLHQRKAALPLELVSAVERNALLDTQYTEQIEDVDLGSPLYRLRLQRNQQAAASALVGLQKLQPDVVLLPNGLILEFGAVFQAARYLGIPVVSYEFGEQRQRVWLSNRKPVMYQDTSQMWAALREQPFDESQFGVIKELVSTRQDATLWNNFARQWQDVPSEGETAVRGKLGLDERPLVLLAANVIGDSLTLDRQTFSGSMTEWIKRTLDFFVQRPEVQFVLRTHPGELGMSGPSVSDTVSRAFPDLPENIHIIPPDAPVNTYDLVSIADLGLVYTTTVGLEMAMSGLPVIVVGNTHYRNKGFTIDPASWEDYFSQLEQTLRNPLTAQPSQQQVQDAWHYAYRFFFNYPYPYPWHLLHFWQDIESWPLSRLFSKEGIAAFGKTFDHLLGQPSDWTGNDD